MNKDAKILMDVRAGGEKIPNCENPTLGIFTFET